MAKTVLAICLTALAVVLAVCLVSVAVKQDLLPAFTVFVAGFVVIPFMAMIINDRKRGMK